MSAPRAAAALVASFALILLAAGPATADLPEGPRIAFTEEAFDSHDAHLRTAAVDGTDVRSLGSPRSVARAELVPGLPFAWSPDGNTIAIEGFRAGKVQIFVASVADGVFRVVPGTEDGISPALSPDGRTLAFRRSRMRSPAGRSYESTSIWTVDLASGGRRQVTRWRNGLHLVPGSFSPDGSSLVASRLDQHRGDGPEVVSVDLATGRATEIVGHGLFPVYSPDGSKIAFLRRQLVKIHPRRGPSYTEISFDLFIAGADGSGVRRLSRTPLENEFWPSFDPSGERLAFSILPGESSTPDVAERVDQMNVDGSCRGTLLSRPGSNILIAAWRPGPGRAAGRIAC